jgi:hypothetical protein
MDEAIEELEERMDEVNRAFEEGDIHRRYREQVNVTRKLVRRVRGKYRRLSQQEVDDDDLERFKAWVNAMEVALNFLIDKAETDEEKRESVISKCGEDFYLKTSSPEVPPPLVIVDESLEENGAGFQPLFEINLSGRNGINFKKQKKVPFVQIPKGWAEDTDKWLLTLHEFSHVLYDYSDHLNYGEGRTAHKAEFFADLLATEVAGPAYLYSVHNIIDNGKDLEATKGTHPAWISRLKAIDDYVETIIDEEIKEQYLEIMSSVDKVEREALEVKESEALRGAQERLEDRLRRKNVTRFSDKWDEVFNSTESNSPINMVSSFVLPECKNQFSSQDELIERIERW